MGVHIARRAASVGGKLVNQRRLARKCLEGQWGDELCCVRREDALHAGPGTHELPSQFASAISRYASTHAKQQTAARQTRRRVSRPGRHPLELRRAVSFQLAFFIEVEVLIVESQDPEGPFGAKECGEGGLAPILPAVANAVHDAVGVRILELPMTPDVVYRALQRKARAEQRPAAQTA